MGLVDLYKGRYYPELNEEEVKYRYEIIHNGLFFSHTFLKCFNWKKSQNSFDCSICNKQKPKFSRYLGEGYQKICSECAVKWFENSIGELQETINLLYKKKKQLEDNSKVWKKEQILGGVS